ncbi:hypothetical protein N5C66_18250 [Rhizobium pusense]|uniref:hypothetical protein n=1 Tax=Agrobacterium pusense TaxID=648995 RepID=UPI000D19F4C6|nr:hypothetical protein [Agrobacterium pusense]MDH0911163.1 hypothetical protein [Agrobacterium pusense]MDH1097232.1 hypothetical protein [Agrobacterium pusense]MDH1113684.1 hypothetical protein [Agrobacterium pusense]MDH2193206.1 hypothetical protein [Agrobacterium pusense]
MTVRHEDTTSYVQVVDLDAMQQQIDALVNEVVSSSLSIDRLRQALATGMNEIASALRAVPIAEGRLLERGIGLVAKGNPDLVVLTDNLRLPVTKAASELVAMNDPSLVRSLSLDADNGGRKSYTPDLLILNRATKIAHVVDVKRSLGSYEVSRIAELKQRMLAAALVVPDLLFKEHRRLHVEEVRVVILNAENQRMDIEGGVWPLNQLDHLVEITGAGRLLENLRKVFRDRVEANWAAALHVHRSGVGDALAAPNNAPAAHVMSASPVGSADAAPVRVPVSIGFARPPRTVGA